MPQLPFIHLGPLAYITPSTCSITYLRGHTKIHLTLAIPRIQNTNFGSELVQLFSVWSTLPSGRARNAPICDLIYRRCQSVMERLAPETILTDLSLEAFMHVAVYELEIRSGGGDGGVCVVEGECVYAPAFFTAPTPLLEAWKAVSRFRARDVEIAPVEARRSVDAVQGRVRTAAGDMYFKPRVSMREDEFARELDILLHIDAAGLADRLRLPKLCGLVVSDGDKVIGLLMTMIGAGTTLRDLEMQGRTDMHGKWEGQVSEIVEMLHEHRIVWGDVHPMNVVIDDHMDAWAVDFGGRNNVDFVDDANRETIAGDWQGLRKIFKEWLVNPESRGRW